jgi:hypothetical protein
VLLLADQVRHAVTAGAARRGSLADGAVQLRAGAVLDRAGRRAARLDAEARDLLRSLLRAAPDDGHGEQPAGGAG